MEECDCYPTRCPKISRSALLVRTLWSELAQKEENLHYQLVAGFCYIGTHFTEMIIHRKMKLARPFCNP